MGGGAVRGRSRSASALWAAGDCVHVCVYGSALVGNGKGSWRPEDHVVTTGTKSTTRVNQLLLHLKTTPCLVAKWTIPLLLCLSLSFSLSGLLYSQALAYRLSPLIFLLRIIFLLKVIFKVRKTCIRMKRKLEESTKHVSCCMTV